MGTKVLSVIGIGAKIFCGLAAGYFVYQVTNEKAVELIDGDDSILNAVMIGTGQSALAVVAYALAFTAIG